VKEIPGDNHHRGLQLNDPIDRLMKGVVYIRFTLVKSRLSHLVVPPVAQMDIGEMTDPRSGISR
jgi:hypothetical protein